MKHSEKFSDNTSVRSFRLGPLYAAVALASLSNYSLAQLEEIVVTAQKRSQSINEVPMSISAFSNEQLNDRGIDQIQDFAQSVPAFNYSESRVGTPIYTLRGVGFNDVALGGRPTVSVYHDEVPVPFAIETTGSFLDLQRVEILKGPQGTLFGQNSTGGAINVIAAKPTNELEGGIEVGYGNYDELITGGYVSGPINDEIRFRVAARQHTRDGWQENYLTGEEMASKDLGSARLLLDWLATDRLTLAFNLNGFKDKGESQAPQITEIIPGFPSVAPLVPGLLDTPVSPEDNDAANWTPANYDRDNKFYQANLRADYQLNDNFMLTSLSSYSKYKADQPQDVDGQQIIGLQQTQTGDIESYFQELRIAGDIFEGAFLTAGVNYSYDETREYNDDNLVDSTLSVVSGGLSTFAMRNDQDIDTYAAFTHLEYAITDALSGHAGVRYTDSKNDFTGCTAENGHGTAPARFGSILATVLAPGGCFTADATGTPTLVKNNLDEDNTSWSVGLDWHFGDDSMLYGNISRGFKSGGFPTIAATAVVQYEPTKQEELTSYEIGFKSAINDELQVNGAVYYYDYSDKQVLGFFEDEIFGPILRLVNIPDSEVTGGEIELQWASTFGLDVSLAASYLESEVTSDFINPNAFGVATNFKGESFPNAPDTQVNMDAVYRWSVTGNTDGFVGANAYYQSSTNSEFGESPELDVDAYTLVDLRAGLEASDGAWKVSAWVRNVNDEYYWTNSSKTNDTIIRFTGMPRTYGISLNYAFGG